MRLSRASTWRAAVVALVLGGVLAGCADNGDDDAAATSSSAQDTTETSSPPSTAEGEPIVVAAIGDYTTPQGSANPEWHGSVEARAAAINAAGGINGRPVEVFVCDSRFDPNAATQCARDAVERGAVAVVGLLSSFDTAVLEVLEEAGVPLIGPSPIGAAITSSELSFPLTSGGPGVFAGLEAGLVASGATRIAALYNDNPPGQIAGMFFDTLAATQPGVINNGVVLMPPDTADFSVVAQTAAGDGTDGISFFTIGDPIGTLLGALKAAAPDAVLMTGDTFLTEALMADLGSLLDDVLIVSQVLPATATNADGIRLFNDDMEAFDASMSRSPQTIVTWLSMWVFERVAAELDTIDAASVLEAMGQIDDMDMGGITPPLTTTEPFDLPAGLALPPVPRLFNPTIVLQRVEGGQLVAVDESDPFIDPYSLEG